MLSLCMLEGDTSRRSSLRVGWTCCHCGGLCGYTSAVNVHQLGPRPADETQTVFASLCLRSTALPLKLPKKGKVVSLYSGCYAVALCATSEALQFTLLWLLTEC